MIDPLNPKDDPPPPARGSSGSPPVIPPIDLDVSSSEEEPRPRIRVSPGNVHAATAEAEQVLAATGQYFTSDGVLVRLRTRGAGAPIERVNEHTLRSVLSASIDWFREGRDGVGVRSDPPQGVVQALMYSQDRSHLKTLNGLAKQPFYGVDGNLVSTPGYDEASGIYADFDGAQFSLAGPSREMAETSLDYLAALLDEFEFESEADRSGALCAMLTAAVRPSLPVAPAFSITATASGSGKSYLADIIIPFAGPDSAHRVSYPTKADEAGKLLVSAFMEQPSAILFDDMQTNWKSLGPINRALTSGTTTERMLGKNRTGTASTRTLILGTGNNIAPERDLRRRVVSIRLAPRSVTPALRRFKGKPLDRILQHRARAVECALAIVEGYRAAGSPDQELRGIGSYGEWSELCRSPLVWLGLPDPATSLIDQVSHDPDQEALAEFLGLWFKVAGTRSITVRKLLEMADSSSELLAAIEDLPVMEGRYINRNRLGWYLSKVRGRWVDDLKLEYGDSSERRSWQIVVRNYDA